MGYLLSHISAGFTKLNKFFITVSVKLFIKPATTYEVHETASVELESIQVNLNTGNITRNFSKLPMVTYLDIKIAVKSSNHNNVIDGGIFH